MTGEPVHVVAFGASTAVGRDAWSSAAAVRAGIPGFTDHPYMIDTAGEPMRVALAPWLDIGLSGLERLSALLFPAVDEAVDPLRSNRPSRLNLALALGLPNPRPGLSDDLRPEISARLTERYGGLFGAAAVFPVGHAAWLFALDAACRKLSQGGLDACVVAGVDSYLEPETLEWLESCEQLHGAGPLNNAWGFIPGEAAGAILIARASVVERLQLQPLSSLLGTGTALESKRIKTDTVCIGEGLTGAFRGTLSALPQGSKVTDVYCDMNGEPYRADEYGFTCLRTKAAFEAASEFVAPAANWGDVAAAGGPLHVVLSSIAGLKGYSRGEIALVWASSEDGGRAAAVLRTGARG